MAPLGGERPQAVAPRHVVHSPGRCGLCRSQEDVLNLYAEAPRPATVGGLLRRAPDQLIGEVRQPILPDLTQEPLGLRIKKKKMTY